MPAIFISYRRSDSQDVTGRIYDRLIAKYERRQVFKDVDNIPLGVSFPAHLKQVLGKAGIALVIIGPTWTTATNADGQRRLDDPDDFVRVEVETALNANMPVIPILVSNASMPQASDLPPSMQKLLLRNGMAVRPDPDFHNDVDRLIAGIEHLQKLKNRPEPKQKEAKAPNGETANPAPSRTEKATSNPTAPANEPAAKGKRKTWLIAGFLAAPVVAILGIACCNSAFFAIGIAMFASPDLDGRWETKDKKYFNFYAKAKMLSVVQSGNEGSSKCDYIYGSGKLRIKPRDQNDFGFKEETYKVIGTDDGFARGLRLEPLGGGDVIVLTRSASQN